LKRKQKRVGGAVEGWEAVNGTDFFPGRVWGGLGAKKKGHDELWGDTKLGGGKISTLGKGIKLANREG